GAGEGDGDSFRNGGWPSPDEVVMFGGDGSDSLFGLWLPAGSESQESAPVVEVGEIFEEDGCMDVAGTGIVPFLAARTAYYVLLDMDVADTSAALDVLDVPAALRLGPDPDEQTLRGLYAWAAPQLPGPPDPYS